MKCFLLILALFFCFPPPASAEQDLPKAVLNIGIYHTFKPTDWLGAKVTKLISDVEADINGIFSRRMFEIKIVFLEYWEVPSEINDADEIYEMFGKIEKPDAEVYVILIDSKLYYRGLQYGGMTDRVGGNEIILSEIQDKADPMYSVYYELLFLHELTHAFGLNHPDKSAEGALKGICEVRILPITCGYSPIRSKSDVVIDDERFTKALYDYYLKETARD
ncbi:MAG: hypothetical protein Q7K44_00395 [Candidatus Liptonbacteria bacterium]|nr:hypothetical protein [Candidatus Liptonbacteria bacterium]